MHTAKNKETDEPAERPWIVLNTTYDVEVGWIITAASCRA